ncbi:MAG: Lrp/AsnC ligand binding domain-containing protein [Candidatus Bathyarchaeota archaeon]|jgi:DNA-binding Lrp family transcriptional regulator|nr:Lrp/AsnC ligand binding domain-containing protein [Candidatus Bathyarchaeota archaeon]
MKVSVYVFVQVEKGEPWKIAAELSKIEGVKTAHTVTGQYDVIVFVELDSLEILKDVVREVQQIEGVQRTQTAVCIP